MSRAQVQDGAQSRQQHKDDGEIYRRLRSLNINPSTSSHHADASDICPVCKSTRYLNRNMRFLINPECYHKMCESCVGRIFSQGPAPCPIAGCARTLRNQTFREPRYEDLQIEREVDIRKKMATVFNRQESEFQTLLDYNNYLEDVETMTFNLIYNVDVPATEAKIAAYREQNTEDIKRNQASEEQQDAAMTARFEAQKREARRNREAAQKEQDEERREREEGRREIIDRIANSSEDPDKITRESHKVLLKKSTARRTAAERLRQQDAVKVDNGAAAPTYTIAGLKQVAAPGPEQVYDPFAGFVLKKEYYTPREKYDNPMFEKGFKTDPIITAGGYDVGEYCARAMLDAFAGLGVFIEDEIAARENNNDAGVGTMSAAAAAVGGAGDS